MDTLCQVIVSVWWVLPIIALIKILDKIVVPAVKRFLKGQ